MTDPTIDEVIRDHTDSLLAMPGVVGIASGLCDDRPCIRVFVREQLAEIQRIPAVLRGYEVRVEVAGEFRPRAGAGEG